MLSWATQSLIADGRSQSDIRQGVTLEVMGEGRSMGPINDEMRAAMVAQQGDFKFDVPWTTLAEYLEFLERRDPTVPFFLKVSFHQPHQPCTPPWITRPAMKNPTRSGALRSMTFCTDPLPKVRVPMMTARL